MEGDFIRQRHSLKMSQDFNPRPPWGGRLPCADPRPANLLFQSTPSVGRATYKKWENKCIKAISIHALRGEGDDETARGDNGFGSFQSTPSVGRATSRCAGHRQHILDFNPRPPWGGRLPRFLRLNSNHTISIHALRGEGDPLLQLFDTVQCQFQSTPSVGRATKSVAR